ncbi:hypothetical protein EVAR_60908_1 [Eumeta japonica]|uniref:Uncharacterized protein n=1 Tax=Eumeta variegata TaxID=151549 RepID=A0A4C1ZEC3_EUMVA|nr:hypothetical protein EVAR_60908_1 [Eumeta japonica]
MKRGSSTQLAALHRWDGFYEALTQEVSGDPKHSRFDLEKRALKILEEITVVFDAAARSGGTSLHHHLLPGPDLLQSLPGVLMRFQHEIAVAADV